MGWEHSLQKLFSYRTEQDLYQDNGAQALLDVIDAFLMPDSIETASTLKAKWRHAVNGIPANPLAVFCADYASRKKEGIIRLDGSPSIVHEFSQIYYSHSLLEGGFTFQRPDLVAALIAIHDMGEDEQLTTHELRNYLQLWIKNLDGTIDDATRVALFADIETLVEDFYTISRFIDGEKEKMNKQDYIEGTLYSPITSIVKPLDRIHNISTLLGAGKSKKVQEKLDETELLFMSPLYKVDGRKERVNYFEAAAILHPENAEVYKRLESIIVTAFNLHVAGRVNAIEYRKRGELVMENINDLIPESLRTTALPNALRPLRLLSKRVKDQARDAQMSAALD